MATIDDVHNELVELNNTMNVVVPGLVNWRDQELLILLAIAIAVGYTAGAISFYLLRVALRNKEFM